MTTTTGSVTDASGPLNYPANSDCRWLIDPVAGVSTLQLTFSYLRLAAGDTVYIYNGTDDAAPLIGKYSGTTTPSSITTLGNTAYVKFLTDAASEADGFFIAYKSNYPVYCTGLTTVTAASDTLTDGSGVNTYNANSNCRWLIQPGLGSVAVKLDFLEFNLEDDMLKVYDPSTVPSTLLATYTGNTLPASVTATNGQMLIVFTSNAGNHGQGWKVVYSTNYGVEDHGQQPKVMLQPNPAEDYVDIVFSEAPEKFKIVLYSITGQRIECTEKNVGPWVRRMDLYELPGGIYQLVISDGERQCIRKLIRK